MKKLVCILFALCLFSVPTFAIEAQYQQIGYAETFNTGHEADATQQKILVRSDGVNQQAVVLEQPNEKDEQETNNTTEDK